MIIPKSFQGAPNDQALWTRSDKQRTSGSLLRLSRSSTSNNANPRTTNLYDYLKKIFSVLKNEWILCVSPNRLPALKMPSSTQDQKMAYTVQQCNALIGDDLIKRYTDLIRHFTSIPDKWTVCALLTIGRLVFSVTKRAVSHV